MDMDLIWHNILSALIFSGIGLAIYIVGFILFDRLTPQVHFWREMCENKNVAIAIFMGSIVLGIAMIISAAIHG
jgi:putative membrane protein